LLTFDGLNRTEQNSVPLCKLHYFHIIGLDLQNFCFTEIFLRLYVLMRRECVCVCVCVFISVLSSRKYFSFSLWLIPRSCDERHMKAAGCLWPRMLQSVTYVSSSSGETFMVNNKLYIRSELSSGLYCCVKWLSTDV
jgi:hypothetical protein